MKVETETKLFTCQFGSHLYGTNVATSDVDLKVVCLPNLDDLLLNRQLSNRKVKPGGDHGKVAAGETETEYLPLQVFLDDYFNGQTYALEVAFGVLCGKSDANQRYVDLCRFLTREFTTRDVSKMVGYVVAQARTYGLKTRRYTSMNEVVALLQAAESKLELGLETRLVDANWLLDQLRQVEHVTDSTVGGAVRHPALDVCGKEFPLTNTVGTMLRALRKSLLSYGERVKQFQGEPADWKALAHAVRVTDQVLELSATGQLVFPRPNAELLKAIRAGQVPLAVVMDLLAERFDQLDQAVERSVLKERTPALEARFKTFKLRLLHGLYDLNLITDRYEPWEEC